MNQIRHTARAIVMHRGNILLMERWRGNAHYFSIPGGGIEAGETPEQAAARELDEETSCKTRIIRPLYLMHHAGREHHIFLAEYIEGEPKLPPDSPEALKSDANDRFAPGWMPLEKLPALPAIIWRPVLDRLTLDLERGFSDGVVEITSFPAG